ncbi:hypothetical protein Enr13x_57020 [Stieleria neptunia]|uniref:Uncharacterized protein n=1 Tax=Stieleria neptunia TaxID=2527979 RepID=A0A518HY73_9BACT|nr:hypothetical protein Enr13x_57020 [Stieleria neptunia]
MWPTNWQTQTRSTVLASSRKLLLRFGKWPFIEVDGKLELIVALGDCCSEKLTTPCVSAEETPAPFTELIDSLDLESSSEQNLPKPAPAP